MSGQAESSYQNKALSKIKSEFSEFRRIGGGVRYPPRLRAMAVGAVNGGVAQKAVAQAAGVVPSTIFCWMTTTPRVKRLCLVETPVVNAINQEIPSKGVLICIRLTSGVEIDLPRGELSEELLATLSALGGGQ